MAYDIVTYPSSVLRQVCAPVEMRDPRLPGIIRMMSETVLQAKGLGLAAPQVGLLLNLFVMQTCDNGIISVLNPSLQEGTGSDVSEEGCLSIPDIFGKVKRYQKIVLAAYTPEGQAHTYYFEGLEARIAQHEYDHLQGMLFIDRLSRVKKMLLQKRLREREKI